MANWRCLSRLKNQLELKHQCYVMCADHPVIRLCQDKLRFYHWCKQHNISHPQVYHKAEISSDHLPLIVKPRFGSAGRGVTLVERWDDFQHCQSELDDGWIIQSYISAQEYTVDVYIDRLGQLVSSVPRKRIVVRSGESVKASIEQNQLIDHETRRLLSGLKLTGHNTIQCFCDGHKVWVSEINLRYGGGFTLSVEAGADTPRWIIRECLGKDISFQQADIDTSLTMLRIQKDVFLKASKKKSPTTKSDIYCVDLDGTLCTEHCPYEDAQPIKAVINRVNALYELGHRIIIASARGASSGKDWSDLIKEQLNLWQVNYHELVSGKPYADFYLDNKSVDVLDFPIRDESNWQ